MLKVEVAQAREQLLRYGGDGGRRERERADGAQLWCCRMQQQHQASSQLAEWSSKVQTQQVAAR